MKIGYCECCKTFAKGGASPCDYPGGVIYLCVRHRGLWRSRRERKWKMAEIARIMRSNKAFPHNPNYTPQGYAP